jgi:type III secretory pathway lipoprotein EscJ
MSSQSGKHKNRHYLLIFLILGACLLTACGRKTVATSDNEFDANRMFDILYSSGFHAEKEKLTGEVQGWNIVIDEGWFGANEASAAIQVLNDYGYPRPPEPKAKEAGGFGMPTEREERERQIRELQLQVERQLYTLPDVIRASVIIAQPTNDILSLDKTPPTASVTLVLKEQEPKFTTETVQGLVSGAVPNLKPANVQVAFSKQALREIPIKELENQRRSNAIFAIGGGIILLLAAVLGGIWYITKRRKQKENAEPEQLNEENKTDELTESERLALNEGNEE